MILLSIFLLTCSIVASVHVTRLILGINTDDPRISLIIASIIAMLIFSLFFFLLLLTLIFFAGLKMVKGKSRMFILVVIILSFIVINVLIPILWIVFVENPMYIINAIRFYWIGSTCIWVLYLLSLFFTWNTFNPSPSKEAV